MKSELKKSFFLRKIGFQIDFGPKYQKIDLNLQNIGVLGAKKGSKSRLSYEKPVFRLFLVIYLSVKNYFLSSRAFELTQCQCRLPSRFPLNCILKKKIWTHKYLIYRGSMYRKIDLNPQNIGVLGAKSGLKKSIFLRKTP